MIKYYSEADITNSISFAFASRKAEVSLQRLTGSYPKGKKRGVGGDNYTKIQFFQSINMIHQHGTVLYFKDL